MNKLIGDCFSLANGKIAELREDGQASQKTKDWWDEDSSLANHSAHELASLKAC